MELERAQATLTEMTSETSQGGLAEFTSRQMVCICSAQSHMNSDPIISNSLVVDGEPARLTSYSPERQYHNDV